MLHAELSPLAAGLPPSILAAAAGRAARLAGISVTDLLDVDAAHEKASIITATLEKVQAQYAKKKAASRDRRSAARKAAPSVVVAETVANAAVAISQISIVGAEPSGGTPTPPVHLEGGPSPPPPPTPSPPPSPPPAKVSPRPSRAPAPVSESEASEEEESEEEDSEPPSPPARTLSRAPSRPAAAPKKAAGNATRARWGL